MRGDGVQQGGSKIPRWEQGAKAALCWGIAEGGGEGPEVFCAAHVPLGRDGGGVPLMAWDWLWEEGSCVSPLLGNPPRDGH